MIIFINIIGGIPPNFSNFKNLQCNFNFTVNNSFTYSLVGLSIYCFIIVLVQDSYKKINIVSARQLNFNYLEAKFKSTELKNSYIPIKLNQGGIMPLVFSTRYNSFFLSISIVLNERSFTLADNTINNVF